MKKQRNTSAFWEVWSKQIGVRRKKKIKEGGVMTDFLKTRKDLGLPSYPRVEACEDDPPDFVAYDQDGHSVAIEVTELVSQEAIQINLHASKPTEYVVRDWSQAEVIVALEEKLADKDRRRFKGGPYNEIHVVIHTDEYLIRPSEYVPLLNQMSFASRQQITRAFLLFSYDPYTAGYPLVELQLAKRIVSL
jgi:hypothetical protein